MADRRATVWSHVLNNLCYDLLVNGINKQIDENSAIKLVLKPLWLVVAMISKQIGNVDDVKNYTDE